jgi:hypothetical protein
LLSLLLFPSPEEEEAKVLEDPSPLMVKSLKVNPKRPGALRMVPPRVTPRRRKATCLPREAKEKEEVKVDPRMVKSQLRAPRKVLNPKK